jgi:hypothetical protein
MGYIKKAQLRSKRRRSPWNLLLVAAVLVPVATIWAVSVLGAEALHRGIYPTQSLKSGEGIGAILATVSPFFGAIPLGLIIGNFLVWLVPSARKTLDAEASAVSGTDFWSSQETLMIITLVLIPISLLLTVYGARLSWS